MQAGELRERIIIFGQVATRTKTGAVKNEWHTIAKVWANIKPLSVKDVLTAQAVGSKTKAMAIIRYRADITSQMQVEHNGKRYEIAGDPLADKNTGREYVTLMLASV